MTDFDEAVPDQSEQLDLQPEDMLEETGREDILDGGYEVPDHYSAAQGFGNTAEEQAEGETLDQRLAQEEPDVGEEADGGATGPSAESAGAIDSDVTPFDVVDDLDEEVPGSLFAGTESIDDGEVGDDQVVRLVDPNEGIGEDTESQLVGLDADDSSEQSAEEAAIHVVPET